MTVFGKPRARSGRIAFDGRDITDLPTHEIARMRIAQSPEGRRIFPRMSVAENPEWAPMPPTAVKPTAPPDWNVSSHFSRV